LRIPATTTLAYLCGVARNEWRWERWRRAQAMDSGVRGYLPSAACSTAELRVSERDVFAAEVSSCRGPVISTATKPRERPGCAPREQTRARSRGPRPALARPRSRLDRRRTP